MPFESIILTGTSCAGKTTIANKLAEVYSSTRKFEIVNAVTTRNRRPDDSGYQYISDEDFSKMLESDSLLLHSEYRGKKYGIIKKDYSDILEKGNIPILIITPAAASDCIKKDSSKYMSVFLDADNEILLERQENRKKTEARRILNEDEILQIKAQQDIDRNYSKCVHYFLKNNEISITAGLIAFLWEHQYDGGGLAYRQIRDMISCGMLLKNADTTMINGASYDLRLGDEYYYNGKICTLSEKTPFLTIEPYDYAIVSCKETACIPRDIIAKFGLTVGLFCQGIILSNGPQIDPGFQGTLFCLLFNTSNQAVHLKRGQHYATIEFNKLMGYANPYEGKYQGRDSIIDYIPANALHGAINELKHDVEKLRSENHTMQNIYLGVVALMFAIISILLVVK